MEGGGYVTIGRGISLRDQVDVINNNVANSSTGGFKREIMLFHNCVSGGVEFACNASTALDTSPGNFKVTDSPLNFAIVDRNGYFAVESALGRRYTRNGDFMRSTEGVLITKSGSTVLSADGGDIVIPKGEISVGASGGIMLQGEEVARIGVFQFEDASGLKPEGKTLYRFDGESPQVLENPEVKQGILEDSNVSPVVETTDLLKASREASDNAALLSTIHQMLANLTQSVKEIG